MSHTLVLVRHGKSDWSAPFGSDAERPLAPRGRRQAPLAGRWIAEHLRLDLAVVSPAVRARQTWDLLAAEQPSPPDLRIDDLVYGGRLTDVVRGLPEDATTVALVGHSPDLEDLVHALTGEHTPMPTSAVAVIDLDGSWSETAGSARLRTAGRPPA